MILRAADTLGCFRRFEFRNDLVNCGCRAVNRVSDWAAAKRAKTFPVSRKIHFWDRNVFSLDVAPNIHLGPVEQWLHADMFAFRGSGYELAPEFGRLILVIPFELCVARRKISLLRTRR